MEQINILSQSSAIILTLAISLTFLIVGVIYSKKHQGLNNYLVANRSIGTFSLTTSLIASALGAWILFGPASAATWGGVGAVIGYALGTAFPLFILIYLGKKFRTSYPKGKSLIEAVNLMRGPPGSSIKITIMRKGQKKPIVINIIREKIKVQSVKSKIIDNNIGYIRLTSFNENSSNQIKKK